MNSFHKLIWLALLFLSSCKLFDSEDIVPAYIEINDFDFEITNNEQGLPVIKVEEVFVFIDKQSIGVYPLPAKIPVITTGSEQTVFIGAAVHQSGRQSSSVEYPFFERFEWVKLMEPEETYEIKPKFTYKTDTKFDFVEGFEEGNILVKDRDGNQNTSLEIVNGGNQSNKSGRLRVTPDFAENAVSTGLNFFRSDNAGGSTYLEFDYRNDVELSVGIVTADDNRETETPLIVLKPREEWNRLYLDITLLATSPEINSYTVFFRLLHDGSDTEDQSAWIDNIKLVHF